MAKYPKSRTLALGQRMGQLSACAAGHCMRFRFLTLSHTPPRFGVWNAACAGVGVLGFC